MPGHVVNATATSPNDVGETDGDAKSTPGDHESPTIEEGTKDETTEVNTNNEKSTDANEVTNSNVGEEGGSGIIVAVVIVLIVVVAGGVGYWLINKKKTSGGASLESGPEVKKEYSEVPTNENDANKIEKQKVPNENNTNKIEKEKVSNENDTNKIEIEKP